MRAIITVGISASGKTTWANALEQRHMININRDDSRFRITGANGWKEYKFNKTVEKQVTEENYAMIAECASRGKSIIISDTNLNPKTRLGNIKFCESLGYEVEIKEFPLTLEEAWKRDQFRGNLSVGRDVIYKQWQQWQQWLEYTEQKKYVPNESLPKAIIFDVDGTLFHMNGRSPFDWDKVETDTVDKFVRGMLWDFQKRGFRIIIMSGRDSICRDETWRSCDAHGIIYDGLFMRKEGDMRKDAVIKTELFWEHVEPYYNVVACIDDRPAMIRAWYDLGIPKVISVGNPWIEF